MLTQNRFQANSECVRDRWTERLNAGIGEPEHAHDPGRSIPIPPAMRKPVVDKPATETWWQEFKRTLDPHWNRQRGRAAPLPARPKGAGATSPSSAHRKAHQQAGIAFHKCVTAGCETVVRSRTTTGRCRACWLVYSKALRECCRQCGCDLDRANRSGLCPAHRKTVCMHGHDLTLPGARMAKAKGLACRECWRGYERKYAQQRRERRKAA